MEFSVMDALDVSCNLPLFSLKEDWEVARLLITG